LYILKIASAFYLGLARERLKRQFLMSEVSAGNVRMCHDNTYRLSRAGIVAGFLTMIMKPGVT